MNFENLDEFKMTELCEIMNKFKSDKGLKNLNNNEYINHNYTTVYYYLFNNLRYEKIRIFELGLGTNNTNLIGNMGADGVPGASLYGWEEFFPNSNIFGADIDKDILFKKNKINTFYCDQTNSNDIQNMWNEELLKEDFDIIIEDGLHEYNANVCFFENSIHKLKKGGYYIIEDVKNDELYLFYPKIKEWKNKYQHLEIELLNLTKNFGNIWDNNLIIFYYK
jgi:SAM-dependent methyltransferase